MTVFPRHEGFSEAEIPTLTGRFALTIIAIVLETAGFPLGQMVFDVITQVISSPVDGTYENTGASVPALPPLTFHW
jgi:hypothetical protein